MLGRISWTTFFGAFFVVFCFSGIVWQLQTGLETRLRRDIRDLSEGITESLGYGLSNEGEIINQVKEKLDETADKNVREATSLKQGIFSLKDELKTVESSLSTLSAELQKLKTLTSPPPPTSAVSTPSNPTPFASSSLCPYYGHLVGDKGTLVARRKPIKIFDTILLLNEVELLKIRIHELHESVDYFIVTESNYTFTGKAKNRHFFDRRDEFKEYEHKIIYINCEFPSELDMANATDPYGRGWDRERYSRSCMQKGLKDAAPTDVVLVGDIDEIPHALALKALKDCEFRFPDGRQFNEVEDFTIGFTQHRFHFNFHCESPNMKDWHGTVLTNVGFVNKYGAEGTRGQRNSPKMWMWGGWHFSNFPFGDPKFMIEKYNSVSHQELQKLGNLQDEEYWKQKINAGGDSNVNTHCVEKTTLSLPAYVWRHWNGKYKPFLNQEQLDFAKKNYATYEQPPMDP